MASDATESSRHLCAFALVVFFWATPVQADPTCTIVRSLLSAESSSQAILATGDGAVAERLINDLDLRLQQISEYAYGVDRRGDEGRWPLAPIVAFVQSRARLVEVYRDRGLAVAQNHMQTPVYFALAQDLRDAMPSRKDCDEETLQHRPEYGSERLQPRPDADAWHRGNDVPLIGKEAKSLFPGTRPEVIAFTVFVVGALGFVLVSQMRRRRAKRYPCNIQTTVRLSGIEQPARITDISRSGARLAVENSCARGDQGEIFFCEKYHAATVMWANSNFAGVKFQHPLSLTSQDLANISG